MVSCSKNCTSEEMINLIIWEENEIKKVPRSRERKQMELHRIQNMSKKSRVKGCDDKGISAFTSLQETLSVIDEEDKSVRILTVLPLESGDRDIRTDEKGNFGESLQLNKWTKGQKRDRWPNKQQQW